MDQLTYAIRNARKFDRKCDSFLDEVEHRQIGLPINTLDHSKIFNYAENNPVSDSYRLLRTRILQRMNEKEWSLLGITSPESGSGKTLTTINLAMALSMDVNLSVIVVDCNLRKPCVGETLGLEGDSGLVEFLMSDEMDYRKYLVKTQINNLYIFPCEKKDFVASEMLTSQKMKHFLYEIKSFSSCIVLFDLPSVFVGDDVIAFSSSLDAMILVIEDGKTSSEKLEMAAQFLEHTPLLGSVLNKSNFSY